MAAVDLFKQKHSVAIRLWHWFTVIFMFASLATVLINSTILKSRNNADLAAEELKSSGTIITQEQSRHVAHAFSDIIWNWHKYIGYGLVFLFLSRIIIEFFQSKEEKVKNRFREARKLFKLDDENKKDYINYMIAKSTKLVFYFTLFVMATTGMALAYEHDFAFLEVRSLHRLIKNIHGIGQYVMYAYIFSHLAGVIWAEVVHKKGIISGMVNGN
ncbi:MAG: cytochrome b/b6 domain-containing protein [Bacteroidia bacterium]|nr:cytochrome b/b6 domain-containing protein [Bacteroidia bacterium]